MKPGKQLDRAGQRGRCRQRQVGAEHHLDAVVQDQDQREGRKHLRQVVARVERAQQTDLERHAEQAGQRDRAEHAQHERAGHPDEPGGEERADHVERAVREVDHVHHAEDQGQARGEQEQHQAELQAVQRLLDEKDAAHADPLKAKTAPRRGAAGRQMQAQ